MNTSTIPNAVAHGGVEVALVAAPCFVKLVDVAFGDAWLLQYAIDRRGTNLA